MADSQSTAHLLDTEQYVQDILSSIEREREREIVARRFGLFDRKETLEQIGELLGITRERVRQLEKSVIARLKAAAEQGDLSHVQEAEEVFLSHLRQRGEAARVSDLSKLVTAENSRTDQSRVAFLASLSPRLVVIEDNDHYHHAVGASDVRDEKAIKSTITQLVDAIKKLGEPS